MFESSPLSNSSAERPLRIVYLAPDCTDNAVKKRVHGMTALGYHVVSFSFRRDRYNVGMQPDWTNIELGKSRERRLVGRLLSGLHVLRLIFRHRQVWRDASLIYARNLDLGLLALVGRFITGCRAPLVYEVLDVHPLLARRAGVGPAMRWLERRVLKRCRMLVISSPAYLTQYFGPLQNYHGPRFVLENKWPRVGLFAEPRPVFDRSWNSQHVWTIGWFGNIRCPQSLRILADLAEALPHRVRIYLRGCTSLLEPGLLEPIRRRCPNVVFGGEYNAPEELGEIYSGVDFNWCGDFSDGDNSVWLLPNRLYEGGFFGVPALGIEGHETGRMIEQRRLGIAVSAPFAPSLIDYFARLTVDDYLHLRRTIEQQPASEFVDSDSLSRLMKELSQSL